MAEAEKDEDFVTVKDICRVGRTDITNKKDKDLLHELVCYSMSRVLKKKAYSDILKAASKSSVALGEILKKSKFREEFVEQLTY